MKRVEKYSTQVEIFLTVCGKLASNHYVTSCGDNLAWKLEEDLLLITPTKMNKGDILPEDLVFIDLKGKVVEGKRWPTGGTPVYLKFFNMRRDIIPLFIAIRPPFVHWQFPRGRTG